MKNRNIETVSVGIIATVLLTIGGSFVQDHRVSAFESQQFHNDRIAVGSTYDVSTLGNDCGDSHGNDGGSHGDDGGNLQKAQQEHSFNNQQFDSDFICINCGGG